MFGEVCSNHTHSFLWGNETILFDHELECTVSKTVFILFSFIGIAGLVGNALVVLGNWHIHLEIFDASNSIIHCNLLYFLFSNVQLTTLVNKIDN